VPESQFTVLDVSDWTVAVNETVGVEAKYWIEEPDSRTRWLFKSVTVKDGHVHGEDWAEKVVAELAGLLGMPCARIELADRCGQSGCISADLRPQGHELQHGQLLLEERKAPGYAHGTGRSHPGHTIENIRLVLQDALPPPGFELGFEASAYDVFAGYLMLDAWVANRDRHDNNWAVLRPVVASGDRLQLCGSYDHASSLGFNLTEERLRAELQRVMTWCQKGTAWRFDPGPGVTKTPTLVDLAAKALLAASPDAWRYWPERLDQINHDLVLALLDRVPRMSDLARTFAGKVLEVNRRRVLDAYASRTEHC
jgi:hypothetical protein